jgi:hypothetical protein
VHRLVAEREYARLMRNMSIEYGLLLLTKLDKLGLKQGCPVRWVSSVVQPAAVPILRFALPICLASRALRFVSIRSSVSRRQLAS